MLKEVVVRLLLKKTFLDPMVLSNYQPISNLLFLGKVTEKAFTNQLQQFLYNASLLDPPWCTFQPSYRMETVLVALMDDLLCHLNKSKSALLIILDFWLCMTQSTICSWATVLSRRGSGVCFSVAMLLSPRS